MRVMAVVMVLALMGCGPSNEPLTPKQIETMKQCPPGWEMHWELYSLWKYEEKALHVTCEIRGVR